MEFACSSYSVSFQATGGTTLCIQRINGLFLIPKVKGIPLDYAFPLDYNKEKKTVTLRGIRLLKEKEGLEIGYQSGRGRLETLSRFRSKS